MKRGGLRNPGMWEKLNQMSFLIKCADETLQKEVRTCLTELEHGARLNGADIYHIGKLIEALYNIGKKDGAKA
jgi:hypothetical protein